MKPRHRRNRAGLTLWLLLGLTGAVLVLFLAARWREGNRAPLPTLGQVSGFQFTNQAGRVVAARDLAGQVWVADLIFTRCPGPCLQMTRNLVQLQQRLDPALPVRLVSLTADPDHDTAGVLDQYAGKAGADLRRWDFLTGVRAEINAVAMQQLLLAVAEKAPEQRETETDLFLHSTKWVLVDPSGRLRGIYEGTEPASVQRILRDIRRLLREG